MHSAAKGNEWFFRMRCHIGVDAGSGLALSMVSTAANVNEPNMAANRVNGDTHVRAKVEYPFLIIKYLFGFQKVFCRGIRKSDLKLKPPFALANLCMVCERCH